jgi:predicted RNase H-like HicB family nuclease
MTIRIFYDRRENTLTIKISEVNILNRFTLPVIIEKDKDGYFAFCPDLQGCYTQGDSYEEVLSNIEDAIRLHIEDRLENGELIPITRLYPFRQQQQVDLTMIPIH